MTFGKRQRLPMRRRSALTIHEDHSADVESLITEAVVRVAKAKGLLKCDYRDHPNYDPRGASPEFWNR